jgi:hypothetical protein
VNGVYINASVASGSRSGMVACSFVPMVGVRLR